MQVGKIYKQMSLIMEDIGHIGKSSKNAQQGWSFRGIDQVYNELHAILAKHFVFTTTEVLDYDRSQVSTKSGTVMNYTVARIKFKFYTDDGSFVEMTMLGEASDSGDKSSNKAMAIAHKYAFLQSFSIPTEEEKDPDFRSHEVTREEPVVTYKLTNGKSNYVIGFGKFKGKTLNEVNPNEITSYVSYLKETAARDKKEIKGQVLEFINEATKSKLDDIPF